MPLVTLVTSGLYITMKANRYTYVCDLDCHHSVIFNGLTKGFIPIQNEALESYVKILKQPNEYLETHPSLLNVLKDWGFIVEDDFDEHKYLKNERYNYVNSSEYKTSLIPTFECNYRCWYCIQQREIKSRYEENWDLVLKHIKKYIIENNIKSYVLSWFGGEPLIEPKIIQEISLELRAFCNIHNVDFSSGITTNGSLLSEDIILMLKHCGINYFQIALDGDLPYHDKVKNDGVNPSSFKLVLNNIVNLLSINPSAQVTLRINYTIPLLKSKRFIDDLNSCIPLEVRSRLLVDLQRVWQIREETISTQLLIDFQKQLSQAGYVFNTDHVFSICYVDKVHNNMIYYNGGVDKCDQRPMDELRGYIDNNGDIIWKETPSFLSYDLLSDGCVCNECIYYPLCYCGCPIRREESIAKNNNVNCRLNENGHIDTKIFTHRIQDYCWRVLLNNKISL